MAISASPMDLLHPGIRSVVEDEAPRALTPETLAMLRRAPIPTLPHSVAVERTDYKTSGPWETPLRVHRPKQTEGKLPCLYSVHGGGYVLGDRWSRPDVIRFDLLCAQLNLVGVSVDYRLAPETPYPGPLEDCYRGLLWINDHADDLGVDCTRIGIGGRSAGGGLAAALALLARDRGEVQVAFQLLDSPMLDDRQITPSSQVEGLPVWSRESNEFGWRAYLGDLYGADDLPYTAAPSRAKDLSGLPSAFISVGAVDGFHDEDVDYAVRLNHAGVPTELHVYPGACHGYQRAATCEITRQSIRDATEWLTRQIR